MSACRTVDRPFAEGSSSLKALYNKDYLLALRRIDESDSAQNPTGDDSQNAMFVFEICSLKTFSCINPFLNSFGHAVIFEGAVWPQDVSQLTHSQQQSFHHVMSVQDQVRGIYSHHRFEAEVKKALVMITTTAFEVFSPREMAGHGHQGDMIDKWVLQASHSSLDYIATAQERQRHQLEIKLQQQYLMAEGYNSGRYLGVGIEKATLVVNFDQLMNQNPQIARRITSPNMAYVAQALGQLLNSVGAGTDTDHKERSSVIAESCIPHHTQSQQCRGIYEAVEHQGEGYPQS